ncbi:MAG: twin-arginine translocase TatA/TatE family subunit [Pseudomonadota bacterium]
MEWSGPELILLFVIALIVLGPERMAQVAKKLGQFVGYARRMSRNFQVQLEDEIEMQQIRDSLPKKVDLKKELGVDKLEKELTGDVSADHRETETSTNDGAPLDNTIAPQETIDAAEASSDSAAETAKASSSS